MTSYLMRDRMPDHDAIVAQDHVGCGRASVTTGAVLHRYRALYGCMKTPWRYATDEERAEHLAEDERLRLLEESKRAQ